MTTGLSFLLFERQYPRTLEFGVYDATAYGNYPGKRHPGTDFGADNNAPTFSPMTGTVTGVYARGNQATGRGNEVVIAAGNRQLKYCHLNAIAVEVGQHVEPGDEIGLVGWTGYVLPKGPAGAHLHIEMLVDGVYVDIETELRGGEDMGITREQIIVMHQLFYGGKDPGPGLVDGWKGRNLDDFLHAIQDDATYAKYQSRVQQALRDATPTREAVIEYINDNLG